MGFTETSLQDHVTSEHAETSTEVVSVAPSVHPAPRSLPLLSWRANAARGGGGEEEPAHVCATFPDVDASVGQEDRPAGIFAAPV